MILDEIVEHTKATLSRTATNRFNVLFSNQNCVLVCELKMKSPSHPSPFLDDIDTVLRDYMSGGVDAISVVTEQQYFGGDTQMVQEARISNLPVLRKDFILEARQIAEVQADAILLIARIVSQETLKELVEICLKLNVEPVVEIHDDADLQSALDSSANTIAVNARDLQTQKINQSKALELLLKIPGNRTKLLFSGITTPEDIVNAREHGAQGVLVGTAALEATNIVQFVHSLKEACS